MGQCHSNDQLKQIEADIELDYNRYSTYQKLEVKAIDIVQRNQINTYYSSLIQRVIASRQDHIIKILSMLSLEQKPHFIQSIEGLDLEMVDSLYHHCYKRGLVDQFQANLMMNIQSNREYGLQLIRDRKVGIIFLAGGANTRCRNKLTTNIGLPSRKCVIQIMFERLKKIIQISQQESEDCMSLKNMAVGVMISDTHGVEVRQYLQNRRNYGFQQVEYMYQKSLPVMNLNGEIQFNEKFEPILNPNGTGNIFPQLNGFIQKHPNLKYIHLLGCENLNALPMDPMAVSVDADVVCKYADTQLYCDDKSYYVNGFFKMLDEQHDPSMTDNSENMRMCLNDMYVNVQFLKELSKDHEKSIKLNSRYHTIKRQGNIQFEKHIFDILEIAKNIHLMNADDPAIIVDDPKKAVIQMSNLHKKWLGIKESQDDELCEVCPNVSYNGEDVKQVKYDLKYPLII